MSKLDFLNNLIPKNEEILSMQKTLASIDEKLGKLSEQIQALSDKIDKISCDNSVELSNKSGVIPGESVHRDMPEPPIFVSEQKKVEPAWQVVVQPRVEKEIVFATFSSPGSSGVISCPEYAMEKSSTPYTYFIMELDKATGRGTYRINPNAKAVILEDLQRIRYFVKEFTINNTPVAIDDAVEGIIVRDGDEWKVERLLEIKLT